MAIGMNPLSILECPAAPFRIGPPDPGRRVKGARRLDRECGRRAGPALNSFGSVVTCALAKCERTTRPPSVTTVRRLRRLPCLRACGGTHRQAAHPAREAGEPPRGEWL